MTPSFALILLVTLVALLQPTSQRSLGWEPGEKKNFQEHGKSFIRTIMSNYTLTPVKTLIAAKCDGRRREPYGFAVRIFEMSKCTHLGGVSVCEESQEDVECQFAARMGNEPFLGLMCYWKRVDIVNSDTTEEHICNKWRYLGSSNPRLQIPEFLKSPHSEVLAYIPPQLENRGGSSGENDWPKNEHERTGFGGVGGLQKLGPNPVLYIVVTSQRWYDFRVLVMDVPGEHALPLYFPEDDDISESFIVKSAQELRDQVGGVCSDEELSWPLQNKRILHKGYLRHLANTDNAWLEGPVVRIDDTDSNCFNQEPDLSTSGAYKWVNLPMDGDETDDYLSPVITPLIANYK